MRVASLVNCSVNVISRKELGVVEPCLPNPPLVSKDKLRTFILEKGAWNETVHSRDAFTHSLSLTHSIVNFYRIAANMEQMAWTNMTTFAGAIRRARELYFTELFEKFEAANKKKGTRLAHSRFRLGDTTLKLTTQLCACGVHTQEASSPRCSRLLARFPSFDRAHPATLSICHDLSTCLPADLPTYLIETCVTYCMIDNPLGR